MPKPGSSSQLQPYAISGTVTLGGSAYQGAKVWVENLSSKYYQNYVDDVTYYHTDAQGHYLIDLANVQTAITNGQTVRVYCELADMTYYADVTVNTDVGGSTQDFAFTRLSGLTDGIEDTRRTDGKKALQHCQLKQGLKDGMR